MCFPTSSPAACARARACASSRGSENDWRRKAAGAPGEGGRAWGTRGAVPSHPLVLLPVTPPAREGVRGAVGETAKRCLRNRIKVLGSWCASTQPAPSFRAALCRASGVLDPGDRTGLWGRGLEGGTRPGGAECHPDDHSWRQTRCRSPCAFKEDGGCWETSRVHPRDTVAR